MTETPAVLNVRSQKQLFIDHRFVENAQGVDLVVNPPLSHQVVLESEKPWETFRILFNSVVDAGDHLKMYYTGMIFDHHGRPRTNLCLAESTDGVHWHRPDLGLFEFQGSRHNNIVAPFIDGAPHYDPNAPFGDPYMMIGILSGLFDPDGLKPPSEIDDPTKHVRLKDSIFGITPNKPHLFTSSDGIHWRIVAGPLAGFACDNWSNQIFYDHRIGKFVSYLRGFPGRRTVHRYETNDPTRTPWATVRANAVPDGYGCIYIENELPMAYDVDKEDRWSGDVQNPAVVPYPWAQDIYLAFPSLHRYYPGPQADKSDDGARHRFRFFNDGVDDVHLYISRDGVTWTRPSRWPYVGLGLWGDCDGGCLFTGLGMVRRGNELWQYYTAYKRTHGAVVATDTNVARICLARQRLDGFVSADAGHQGGEFSTPALTFVGNRLVLNINCSALGEAWVEIQDADGRPIPGFSMQDCDPIDLNHIATPVTWKNSSDVSSLQGRGIRLKFRMRLAKLYAFQFVEDQPS